MPDAAQTEEINHFLRSHKVIDVRKASPMRACRMASPVKACHPVWECNGEIRISHTSG